LLHWLSEHRRKKILQTPFPPEWERILEDGVAHDQRLDPGGVKGQP
jgi:hypothetical protein